MLPRNIVSDVVSPKYKYVSKKLEILHENLQLLRDKVLQHEVKYIGDYKSQSYYVDYIVQDVNFALKQTTSLVSELFPSREELLEAFYDELKNFNANLAKISSDQIRWAYASSFREKKINGWVNSIEDIILKISKTLNKFLNHSQHQQRLQNNPASVQAQAADGPGFFRSPSPAPALSPPAEPPLSPSMRAEGQLR
jgi:hypothetical protein